jgi:hypothetical protein
VEVPGEILCGGAYAGQGRLVTWGDRVRIWSLPALTSRVLAVGAAGSGGCVLDSQELITVRGTGLGDLVTIGLTDGRTETLDTQVEMPDCVATSLFGRKGVLMIHRGMQVRFYYRDRGRKWVSRDIYSIYTPSYQTGLAIGDVNADGRPDIFCGNYWIASPDRWEESWRLFAINTWFEDPRSASLRIEVITPRSIIATQAQGDRGARFTALPDPRQQWNQTALPTALGNTKALLRWNGITLAGADSRLLIVETGDLLSRDRPVLSIVPAGADTFLSIDAAGVTLWRQRPRK